MIPILQTMRQRLREVKRFKHITQPASGRGSVGTWGYLTDGVQGGQPTLYPEQPPMYLFGISGCLTKLLLKCVLWKDTGPVHLPHLRARSVHPGSGPPSSLSGGDRRPEKAAAGPVSHARNRLLPRCPGQLLCPAAAASCPVGCAPGSGHCSRQDAPAGCPPWLPQATSPASGPTPEAQHPSLGTGPTGEGGQGEKKLTNSPLKPPSSVPWSLSRSRAPAFGAEEGGVREFF